MSLFYSVFVFFWFILITIKYTYDRYRHKKFVGILLYKIGLKRQIISPKKNKTCIWIHATSFGETMSTKTLVHKLRKEKKDYHIIFSTFTTVGYKLAKTIDGIDQVIILPIDLKLSMKALVKNIKPDLFILIESDYWLNLLSEVKKYGAKVILVGGRISDRSFKRFSTFKYFAKVLFSKFDYLLLQDKSMKQKFLSLGVKKEKIQVIGNLKLDTLPIKEKQTSLNLPSNRVYITLGSTHKNEELLLLDSLKKLDSNICFILAPRRPDRFDEVENLLNEIGISWRFSHEKGSGAERVVFVNKLGILQQCYAKSDLAIVGGSFIQNAGGHNVYEPVRLGTRVLYGPYAYNQKSLTMIVENYGVGKVSMPENIYLSVIEMLKQGRISSKTLNEIKNNEEGATEKATNLINSLF